jgi:hypothetical protein
VEQKFLIIDCSVSPARVAVFSVSNARSLLVESFEQTVIRSIDTQGANLSSEKSETQDAQQNIESSFDPQAFVTIATQVEEKWEEALVILPGTETLFLHLSLPFSDRKSIQKVISLEIQDLVPFEINDFHTDFSMRQAESGSKVRVAVAPRQELNDLLNACRTAGIEPSFIIPPSTAGTGLLTLIPGIEKGCVAVVYGSEQLYTVLILQDGIPIYERIIPGKSTTNTPLSEVLLAIHSSDAEVGDQLNQLFTVGHVPEADELGTLLGVEVTSVATEPGLCLAQLSSVLLSDEYTGPRPTNFRSGTYSYSPLAKELIRGGKGLIPITLKAAALAGAVILGTYLTRSFLIKDLEATVRRQILETVPDLAALPGEELSTLKNQMQSLQGQLQDLGSPSERSPLDILVEIAKYVPLGEEVSIRRVNIKGDRVVLEGTAPDYSAVDRIEKSLRRRKQLFCRLRREQASSGGAVSQRGFLFDFQICN